MAQALIGDVIEVAQQAENEVESIAAFMALETVLPKDIDRVPVERILDFREKFPGERAAFQGYIAEFLMQRQWLDDIQNPEVLEKRLESEYEKSLKPKMAELREKLRSVNIDTIMGSMGIQFAVPAAIAQAATLLGVDVNPVGATMAGAAMAIIPILRDRRKAIGEVSAAPTAYLLRIEQELRPFELMGWVVQGAKKFGIMR
jgi:hypothetical protein